MSRENDSDDDFFSDDEDDPKYQEMMRKMAEQLKKKSEQNKKEQKEYIQTAKNMKKAEINLGTVNKLLSNPTYKELVNKYVMHGNNLNEKIRNGTATEDDKKFIKDLTANSKSVQEIFNNTDYLKVCRMQTNLYNKNEKPHPLSTANICLQGRFGNLKMYIYIPKDANILIADITDYKDEELNILLKGGPLFEIIIPPMSKDNTNQLLLELGEHDDDNMTKYYVVNSRYSLENYQLFRNLYNEDRLKPNI